MLTAPPAERTPTPEPPLIVDSEALAAREAPDRPKVPVTNRPKVELVPTDPPPKPTKATGRSVSGKASWYCKAGVSSCHYRYLDGPGRDLYAAACGKLRRAIGRTWRNDVVRVTSDWGSVRVKLVDYCASEDKTIDLYWDAFRIVRSPDNDGVVRVKVGW